MANNRPIVGGVGISQFPNLRYYDMHKGYEWARELQKRLDELADLTRRYGEVQGQIAALRTQIETAEEEQASRRAAFLRGLVSSAPSLADIDAMRGGLRELEADYAGLERACMIAEGEIMEYVSEGTPDAVLDKLRKHGRQHAERIAKLQAEIDAEQRQHDTYAGLYMWAQGHEVSRFRPEPPRGTPSRWYEPGATADDEAAQSGMTTSYNLAGAGF